jgi:hypothetical protein
MVIAIIRVNRVDTISMTKPSCRLSSMPELSDWINSLVTFIVSPPSLCRVGKLLCYNTIFLYKDIHFFYKKKLNRTKKEQRHPQSDPLLLTGLV